VHILAAQCLYGSISWHLWGPQHIQGRLQLEIMHLHPLLGLKTVSQSVAYCSFGSAWPPVSKIEFGCLGRGVTRMPSTSGCALSGFVLVKKVPGTLHFLAKSHGHSFDHQAMNMSHVVNYLYFGNKPSPRKRKVCSVVY
jgi:Endoplasmic reticulum vesicle transporter